MDLAHWFSYDGSLWLTCILRKNHEKSKHYVVLQENEIKIKRDTWVRSKNKKWKNKLKNSEF